MWPGFVVVEDLLSDDGIFFSVRLEAMLLERTRA